jgi:hypothetical protein
MIQKKIIAVLVISIAILSAVTTSFGIFSDKGPGSYSYKSIRGNIVNIYGKGIYGQMSSDVAIQGIAQDYVTLFAGIPLLLISLIGFRKGSLRSQFLLTGTSGYFFVTFLFYTTMAMYNCLFLFYAALLSLSFFALLVSLSSFDLRTLTDSFSSKTPNRFVGGFLIFDSVAVAGLWLSIIVPPLIDRSVYPSALEHYTTLIVQGMDLGLLLPMAFVSGVLFIKMRPVGYLAATTYIIFLSILMTALSAKIIAMALNDVNVIPAIFIIPLINFITVFCAFLLLKNIINKPLELKQGTANA